MYQSFVYLEIRVLLSSVPGVFIIKRQGERVISAAVQPAVLHKVSSLVHSLGGGMVENAELEKLTAKMLEPPDDRNFTGYSAKVASGGSLEIFFHQRAKRITIEEVRIEEDCGHLTRTNGKARMDWTFAGCPSMRIKTSAVFELGEEAEIFLQELYTLIVYLNLLSGDSGESAIRCNAYVSLAEYPKKPDYIVKLRNLNSFNFVRKAINSELSRQEEILSSGGNLVSESRLWIAEKNTTQSWQKREMTPQKKQFEQVSGISVEIASHSGKNEIQIELPAERRKRLHEQYSLSRLRSQFICGQKDRADYFEETVVCGAPALLSAHWMAGELTRLLNKKEMSIKLCPLTPKFFAQIMLMLSEGKIHSGMAKNLMLSSMETGKSPEELSFGLTLLSSEAELLPFIEKVLRENPKSVSLIQQGDMAPLEYLTGCVMKESAGRADPLSCKTLIKKRLAVSVVYVLTMGGAITARKISDGTIAAGNASSIKLLLDEQNKQFPILLESVSDMLSEETEPSDWAKLISKIALCIESGIANGIVVTHGTDTLSYTAALLFWLFGGADVPIVLTASSSIPQENTEAAENLNAALRLAREKKRGVFVVYGNKILSPLNLKFFAPNVAGFSNWNLENEVFSYRGGVSSAFLSVSAPESEVMGSLLNEAAKELSVLRLYPGLPTHRIERFINGEGGAKTVIVEFYASGTANMRNSDYSIRHLLVEGSRKGKHFYCTSQQACGVDFSQYTTSAQIWRQGAVPMANLTTESVVALYFASYLVADNEEELSSLMENAGELCLGSSNQS